MKKINRNIFKPFMFICLGLMAVMLMSAASPCDPPGIPGKPVIVDYGKDWCEIEFTPPKSDGGSPIAGYFIEYRYRGGIWEKISKYTILAYRLKINSLIPGNTVEFRVSAVSTKGGQGLWSDPSEPHIIRDR